MSVWPLYPVPVRKKKRYRNELPLVAHGLTESGVNVTTDRYPRVAFTVDVVFSLTVSKSR